MAVSNVYTLGLSKIEIGEPAADGGMGTTLEQLGYTYKDSCTLKQEDPETTDFFAEEVDDPVITFRRAGKITFSFSIMNPDFDVFQKMAGGTVTGSGANAKWEAPDSLPFIEKSVKITPQQGLIFEVPRMSINAKINGSFSKTNLFLLDIVGTVLIPNKAGTKKMSATKIAAA
ncbi:MAG: hypothetical protein FWF53_02995 [Candidatus Azobacteroides sp.]|nr:hypothetical protein [Candidatus Azobacteroides sp.]